MRLFNFFVSVIVVAALPCRAGERTTLAPATQPANATAPATQPRLMLFHPDDSARIYFVWDDYSEMADGWANAIRQDLERAIRGLKPDQRFSFGCRRGRVPSDGAWISGDDQGICALNNFFKDARLGPAIDRSPSVSLEDQPVKPQTICLVTVLELPDVITAVNDDSHAKCWSKLVEFAQKERAKIFGVALLSEPRVREYGDFKRLTEMFKQTGGTLHGVTVQELRDAGYEPGGETRGSRWWGPRYEIVKTRTSGESVQERIIFLCDASSSMAPKMAFLKGELTKATAGLKPVQLFNVILFQGSACISLFRDGLRNGSPSVKRQVPTLLDGVNTVDATNPIAGIEAAFECSPTLILMASGGPFADDDAVVKRIEQLNKDRRTKISTLLIVKNRFEREQNVKAETVLKKIANDNNGTFRAIEIDRAEYK